MPVKYLNPGRIEFDAKLNSAEGGGTFVYSPNDVGKLYGVQGRVPVRAHSTASLIAGPWSGWGSHATCC